MKNILKISVLLLFAFISCKSEENDNESFAIERPIKKVMFAVDKSSDEYKLFIDKNGKIKKDIRVVIGNRQILIDEIIDKNPNQESEFWNYFQELSKVEQENHHFMGLSTKGESSGSNPGWYLLNHVLYEIDKPFYITIGGENKFKIIVVKKPITHKKKMIVNTNVMVNGEKTKFLYSIYPILYLNN